MPEVVSCPKCQRKSRVPDALVGKRVKCPGCAEIFTATVGAAPPPKKEAPPKTDEDEGGAYEVVDDRKRGRVRDDDDEEERVSDRPRGRRRAADDEDEDEDRPRRRRGRDEDDEDEDRPRRRRLSRDEDEDDDDEDDEGPPRRSMAADWPRVRLGFTLLLSSVLTQIGAIVFAVVGGCCVGASMAGMAGKAAQQGQPPGAGGVAAMGAGFVVIMVVVMLAQFAAWVMKVVGSVMFLPSPGAFAAKTLALVGLCLVGAQTVFSILDFGITVVRGGMAGFMAAGNPMMGGAGAAGSMAGQLVVELIGVACGMGWFFVIGFYTRAIGLALRNYSLAGTAKGWLIALGGWIATGLLLVIVAVATIGLAGLNFANQMQGGGQQGPGMAGGAAAGGGIAMIGLGCLFGILALTVFIWYIVMLAQARGAVGLRRSRR